LPPQLLRPCPWFHWPSVSHPGGGRPTFSLFPQTSISSLATAPPAISVRNCSGPSLRIRVRVQTEPLPMWRSVLLINLSYPLGYSSMVNSQPVCIGWGDSGSPSGFIYRFIYGSYICSVLIVSYYNRVFSNH
jgi:hypothetical protein